MHYGQIRKVISKYEYNTGEGAHCVNYEVG